jgi:hypothetical protein
MKKMKPVLVFICCTFLSIAKARAQDMDKLTISIELKNASLEEAFTKIESLTTFKFNYKTADIAGIKGINYRQQHVTVKKILTDITVNTSLQFEQLDNYIVVKKTGKHSSRSITIYGFVTAASSGESLIGATVNVSGNKTYSTITNAYGFYSVTVPAAAYTVNCSYVGFKDLDTTADLHRTYQHNFQLALNEHTPLQTVIVATAAKKNLVKNTITGYHRLSIAEIKKIAMPGGEADVLKSLQFLPGIQTSAEGTTNLSVRGGSYDQNLILLDEAPVYNPTHTLGFFSAFNTDALKDVAIYKGVFPSWYGSRLSSVVDTRMKEGNSKKYTVTGGIGFLASRLTVEGPIEKDNSSFIVSGRYSNIGLLLGIPQIAKKINQNTKNSQVSFYDLNVKLNKRLGQKDRLYLSAYTGHDKFFLNAIDKGDEMNWGNTTVTARWNHVFNSSLFANTSLLYSNYKYSNDQLQETRSAAWRANLKELTLKTDLDLTVNGSNRLKFGTGLTLQDVLPGEVTQNAANSSSKEIKLNNRSSAQLFAYLNNEQKISKHISLMYGLRATWFAALGDAMVYRYNADTSAVVDSTHYSKGEIIKSYVGMEPRATVNVLLSPTASIKFSYGRNYQYQHLLTNSSVGLPTDVWMPSDSYFKPQYVDQFAAGLYKTILNDSYEGSIEGYYRKSYNIIDFKDNAELFLNDKIETQILTGEQKGYGLEFMLKKNSGASTGWISYTWSRALRQINGVNNNEWYPPTYDHRHNISFVYSYSINKRTSVSVNWVYRSGGRTTIPLGTYTFYSTRWLYYGQRNGYQMPANHRLDISATWKNKERPTRKWQGEWVFSIYNAYNRQNIFALFINQSYSRYTNSSATQVYLTGILPSITYNFKF